MWASGGTGTTNADEAGWKGKRHFNDYKAQTTDQGNVGRGVLSNLPRLRTFWVLIGVLATQSVDYVKSIELDYNEGLALGYVYFTLVKSKEKCKG